MDFVGPPANLYRATHEPGFVSIALQNQCVNIFKSLIYLLIITAVTASDPDILTDFIVPANTSINAIDGNFFTFTFTRMRTVIEGDDPPNFKVSKASMAESPALNGQSVSTAILQFPAGAINLPHTHPHSAKLLFVVSGNLEVGFIDTTNKLYTQTLQIGDMFVFPKELVHYQYNSKADQPAAAISAFGSASAGTVSVPTTMFATGI